MEWKTIYTKKATEDLLRLPRKIAKRIVDKIKFFDHQSNPLVFAKRLEYSELAGYRFRIGDYRVLFDVDKEGNIHILKILRVKYRKDVYNLN